MIGIDFYPTSVPAPEFATKPDREFVVVLFDWTFENPMRVLDKIVRALSWDGAGK